MDYAVAIGETMELSLDRIGLLRFAGLLHDLGKLGVAEEILVKPSSLTDEEMARVRRHSEVGASIVEQIRVLEELTPIVRHHHEHFDGKGYPDGLAGEQIPLEARILAVADAYEAMTGKRTHRKRLAPASARLELQRGAGTQFDPDAVEALLRVLDFRALGASTGAYGVALGEPHLPV
jgi:putative nucleotidyltransferase with HDIG domain